MQPGGLARWALARIPSREWRPAGFSLLASGCLSGLVGIAAVLFSQGADGMQRYTYREVAGAALSLALVLFMAGATLSLPVSRLSRAAGALGVLLCMAGIGWFVLLYPYFWNVEGQDHSALAVVTYGAGLSVLVAAVTGGLVSAYVESRARRAGDVPDDSPVTDEEVMRDLLETTSRSRLTWGGVLVDDRQIHLDGGLAATQVLHGNFSRLGVVSLLPHEGLEDDVGNLLAFRGAKDADEEEYDDSTVGALANLRQEQATLRPPTVWDRIVGWFRR